MKLIKVSSVSAIGGTLRIAYDVSPALASYFSTERIFEVEYSENIASVPESILVIPFVCNVLPIVWLTDATLLVPQLDKEFHEGLANIRKGYIEMTPMLAYKGTVQTEKLADNRFMASDKTAAFFSGGVDAFATLVAHAEERPQLITIWGADVKLKDTEGWSRVKQHAIDTSHEFDLPAPLLVRSNFRLLVNEETLGELVSASGDGWWHGFQHGIALIAHAAPFACINHWKTVYIASSYTPDVKAVCASDPTIDNHVHLASTNVWHDQYEYNRQQKVRHIVDFCQSVNRCVNLRVCWITAGGGNCCICEKCIRTILALLAEGVNPAEYGFEGWQLHSQAYKEVVCRTLDNTAHLRSIWQDILNRFIETQACKQDVRINWIYKLDINRPLTPSMRLKTALRNSLPHVWLVLRYIKSSVCGK